MSNSTPPSRDLQQALVAAAFLLASGGAGVPPLENFAFNASGTKHCTGCDCDCGWVAKSGCGSSDGSCCWQCCCGKDPPAPAPGPPAPSPPGFDEHGSAYCGTSGTDATRVADEKGVASSACAARCAADAACSCYDHRDADEGECRRYHGHPAVVKSGDGYTAYTRNALPPTPPTPAPPSPPPSPGGGTLYCPSEADWKVEYGAAKLNATGWHVKGGGRVASRAAFNLLGGYVQFDMDTRGALTGVNNNFYLTSPTRGKFPAYCDIQGSPGCMEMDVVENNGNCEAQTTWHTENGHVGKGNCNRGGCEGNTKIKGSPTGRFTVKAEFSADGVMKVTMDGEEVEVKNPKPDSSAKDYVKETMEELGGQIHSSQWTGWVPGGSCGSSGKLDDSVFYVQNVRILGKVVQGDTPTKC